MKIHHMKNIMELLRTYLESEVIDAEEFFYVADHSGFRYFKIKKNEYLVFLFENLGNGICRETLFERAKNEGLDTYNLKIILEGLMKKDIVEEAFFPEEVIDFEFDRSEIPELLFSKRFGLEIGWLSNFEYQDRNRFQMFNKLKSSKIAIVGAGGLGANIAVLAAATGVGKVLIVDGDIVEESNLVRQLFYKETDCGKTKKVDALRRFLNEFSTYTDVETVDTFIRCKEDADQCLYGADIVIQTADTPRGEINRIVNDFCVARETAAIYCSNELYNHKKMFCEEGKSLTQMEMLVFRKLNYDWDEADVIYDYKSLSGSKNKVNYETPQILIAEKRNSLMKNLKHCVNNGKMGIGNGEGFFLFRLCKDVQADIPDNIWKQAIEEMDAANGFLIKKMRNRWALSFLIWPSWEEENDFIGLQVFTFIKNANVNIFWKILCDWLCNYFRNIDINVTIHAAYN